MTIDVLMVFGFRGSIARTSRIASRTDSENPESSGWTYKSRFVDTEVRSLLFDQLNRLCEKNDLSRIYFLESLGNTGAQVFSESFESQARELNGGEGLLIATASSAKNCNSKMAALSLVESPIDAHGLRMVLRVLASKYPKLSLIAVDSKLAWSVVAMRDKALENLNAWSLFVFCEEKVLRGLVDISLFKSVLSKSPPPKVAAIITDNQRMQEKLKAHYTEVRGPVEVYIAARPCSADSRPPDLESTGNVVWVGRDSYQKGLSLALRVARKNPAVSFEFVIAGQISQRTRRRLDRVRNLRLCSEYSSVESFFSSRPQALLYSSRWDGTANILLEALANRTPIVGYSCKELLMPLIQSELSSQIYILEQPDELTLLLQRISTTSSLYDYERFLRVTNVFNYAAIGSVSRGKK